MLRSTTTVATALTLLTITGCTASPDETSASSSTEPTASSANPDATEEPDPSSSATPNATEEPDPTSSATLEALPGTDVKTDGPFATEALDHLLTTLTTVYHDNVGHSNYTDDCDVPFETLEDYQACSPTDPAGYLASIESPRDGELIITLMPEAWGGGEYDPDRVYTVPYLAGNLHSYIGRHVDGLLEVTTTTPDGEYQATEGLVPDPDEPDAPQTEAELQAWADDRFEDWLHSMDNTYQGMCVAIESVEDYRECVPDDPHGYITGVESPAYGELVVHIENGPWQGGQYDPAAYFVASNMVMRIGETSDKVALLTVITEDGQRETVQYNPSDGSYLPADYDSAP